MIASPISYSLDEHVLVSAFEALKPGEQTGSYSNHPQFMFTPRNLAASCVECNVSKGDKETLTNANRTTYPTASNDFRVVHPHYDAFADHIFRFGMIYVAKTKKGKTTIYACDLLRFGQQFIKWDASAADSSFELEVDTVFKESPMFSQAAVEQIISKLPTR
jgi:hypothetical protein